MNIPKIIKEEVSNFINENKDRYYIAAGQKEKLYTLRREYEEYNSYQGGMELKSQHVATLSKDLETAKQKAKERLGYVPEVEYSGDLGKISQNLTFEHMPNGKFEGVHFKKVPTEYLSWWKGNYQKTASYRKIVQAILTYFKEIGLYKELDFNNLENTPEKEIKDYVEYAKGAEDYDENIKKLGDTVGGDLLKFKLNITALPFGKHKDVPFAQVPGNYLEWMMNNMIESIAQNASINMGRTIAPEDVFNNGVSNLIKMRPFSITDTDYFNKFRLIATLHDFLSTKEPDPEPENPSEFVGNVGEKIEADVTVLMVKPIDTQFGLTFLVKMVDENGNNFTTFGNNAFTKNAKQDDKVKILGTVKKHETYRGEKATTLNRVKQI